MDFAGSAVLSGSTLGVLAASVATAAACEFLTAKTMGVVRRAKWWPNAMPLQKAMMRNFGYPEEACSEEAVLEGYTAVCVMCLHHLITGSMCLPVAIYGWSGGGEAGRILFSCAGLAEVALSIYDIAKRAALTFFPDKFLWLGTPSPIAVFIIVCVLHHSLAIAMVIPMRRKYVDLRAYHLIVCSLLLAAGICLLAGQYKLTLDTRKRTQMAQCKVIVLLQFVTLWYTRGYVWCTQFLAAAMHFQAEADWAFFIGSLLCGTLMSLFNLVMLFDSTKAVLKWLPGSCSACEVLASLGDAVGGEDVQPQVAANTLLQSTELRTDGLGMKARSGFGHKVE